MVTLKAIQWFKANGYIVKDGMMEAARNLAEAEVEAKRRGWRVDWEAEDLDPRGQFCDERDVKAILDGRATWECAVLRDEHGDVLTSLGGISCKGYGDPYHRVVAAELALECLPDLRAYAAMTRDEAPVD